MAAEVLKHPDYASFGTDDFFEVALEEGFTKQGEMFWAEDLSKLAELVLNCQSKVIYGNIFRRATCNVDCGKIYGVRVSTFTCEQTQRTS